MMLLPLLCLLTAGHGPTSAQEISVVTVPEGEDAVLPCTLHPEHNIKKFHWKKDNGEKEKKEVFFYENGDYYGQYPNDQRQDVQFRDRVEFFKDELKHGNAAIKIKNTHFEHNGTYTCVLFDSQNNPSNINIRLNVGAAPLPYVKTVRDKITWRLLECKVQGDPQPEVEWRNSAQEVLRSTEKYVEKQNGRFHVQLTVNVTKSDSYTCVATQWGINHQINNTLEVSIPDVVHVLAVSGGDDAVLPCFLDSKDNIESMVFSWSKDHQEVFLYDRGRVEEEEQFKGRLTHFHHELKFGNASIKIQSTQKSDSGRFTCHFPDAHKSHVMLYVVGKEDKLDVHKSHVMLYVVALILFL